MKGLLFDSHHHNHNNHHHRCRHYYSSSYYYNLFYTFYFYSYYIFIILLLLSSTTFDFINCKKNRKRHIERLSSSKRTVPNEDHNPHRFDEKHFRSILDNILIPRSVNSEGHEKVRQYIKNTLRDLNPGWRIEEDVFRARTPAGQVKFRNIIATYVPEFGCVKTKIPNNIIINGTTATANHHHINGPLKRTVLACHYDSLYPSLLKKSSSSSSSPASFSEAFDTVFYDGFTGATDAAVSCAMMIYLAHYMTDHLEKLWQNKTNPNRNNKRPSSSSLLQLNTLQLVFFDGEEQLHAALNPKWKTRIRHRKTNSIKEFSSLYGSRHLASKWEENFLKLNQKRVESERIKQQQQQQQQSISLNNKTETTNNMNIIKKKNGRKRHKKFQRIIMCDGLESQMAKMRATIIRQESMLKSSSNRTKRNGISPRNNKKRKRNQQQQQQEYEMNSGNRIITEISILTPSYYHSIDGIELFILLDLIGGSSTRFYNTNLSTSKYFQRMIQIEKNLLEINGNNNNKKNNVSNKPSGKAFFQQNPPFMVSLVQDDHLPFVVRNVPVLHLIPHPFPKTWHSIDDNIENLNFPAINRLATILHLFLVDLFK